MNNKILQKKLILVDCTRFYHLIFEWMWILSEAMHFELTYCEWCFVGCAISAYQSYIAEPLILTFAITKYICHCYFCFLFITSFIGIDISRIVLFNLNKRGMNTIGSTFGIRNAIGIECKDIKDVIKWMTNTMVLKFTKWINALFG